MKKTLSKIFGVAMAMALVASMIIAVVPTAALTITSVSLSNTNISAASTTYTIKFTGSLNLVNGDTVTVTFPAGTDLTTLQSTLGNSDVTFSNGTGTTTDVPAADITVTPAAGIVTFNVPTAQLPATTGYAWTVTINKVINPASPGSYSLSVATSEESTGVSSAAYTIGVPVVVSVYNSAGNFTGSYSTPVSTAALVAGPLQQALNAAGNGDTIKLAPGTYAESATNDSNGTTTGGTLGIYVPSTLQNVTITTTGSAADTIIANPPGPAATFTIESGAQYITIDNITFNGLVTNDGAYTTFDNCSFNYPGGSAAMTLFTNDSTGTNLTVENCAFDTTAAGNTSADVALSMGDTGSVSPFDAITNCTFKLNQSAALQQDVAIEANNTTNFTASGCTFTGSSAGIGYQDYAGATATFSNNTFTTVQNAASLTTGSGFTFQGNTVTGCVSPAAPNATGAIVISTVAPTSVNISGNSITGGAGYSMVVGSLTLPTQFAVVGNTFSSNALGINAAAGTYRLNYWGSAGGPNATGSDVTTASTVPPTAFEPYLGAAPTAANAAFASSGAVASYDFTAPVNVGVQVNNVTVDANTMVVAQNLGTANPSAQETPFPAANYYDVYMSATPSGTNIMLNFYATGITTGSQMYYYSGATSSWVLCSDQGVAGSGAYVYVTVGTSAGAPTAPAFSDLHGTYFAMVSGQALPPSSMTAVSPTGGSTQGLTGIPFTWSAVKGSTGYQIVISANGDLSSPVVSENVSGTAYAYTGTLQPGAYFWQVSAYQNNAVINQTPVTSFMAAAPTTAVTQPAPTITITSVPAPTITMTQAPATTLTITQPAVQEVTPAWIWGIIGIGAVLIIVVIVLIVRTRRSV